MSEPLTDVAGESAYVDFAEKFVYEVYRMWKSKKLCERCATLDMGVGMEEHLYKKAYTEYNIANQVNTVPLWKKSEAYAW